MNFKSLPQLLDFFKEESTCIEYYEQIRWNGNPVCPHCDSERVYKTNRGYKYTKYIRLQTTTNIYKRF